MDTPLPSHDSERVRRGKRAYRRPVGRPPTHGASVLARVLNGVRLDELDGRTQVGHALRKLRQDLENQLGSPTAAERILVAEAAKLTVIASAVSSYILQQQSLVSEGGLLPVVESYGRLVGNLTRLLSALGLKRRTKRVPTLPEYLAAKTAGKGAA